MQACSSLTVRICSLLFLSILVLLPLQARADECGTYPDLNEVRDFHLKMLNKIRKRQGVEQLDRERRLDNVAQDYACVMAKHQHFSHTGPDGSTMSGRVADGGYKFCLLAENIAFGQGSVVEVMKGWINSEGHWQNMKRKGLRHIGFGVAFYDAEAGSVAPDGPGSLSQLASSIDGVDRKFHGVMNKKLYWVQVFGAPCE